MPTTTEVAIASVAAALALTGATIYAALAPQSRLFGAALAGVANPANGKPQIALTFDDGPNPRWTPMLLDLLDRHEIKATFFLVGMYATQFPDLVRRAHAAGHLIGNHTWTHPNLARTSSQKTRNEITRTSARLEDLTGTPICYFRPPFGLRRPATFRIARELGLIPVTWNSIGNDWTPITAEQIADRVTGIIARNQQRGNATNSVLHDGSHRGLDLDRSRTIAATEMLIQRHRSSHDFVRLDAWAAAV